MAERRTGLDIAVITGIAALIAFLGNVALAELVAIAKRRRQRGYTLNV